MLPSTHPPRRPDRGFSYIMVLVAVVVVGIVAEAAHITTWRLIKADREAELLFRGQAYRRAVEGYHRSNSQFPRSLEDLLKDPRSASRRYIRALYPDPMATNDKQEWLLVRASDGGIAGVASASKEEPLKQAEFPKEFEKFTGAKAYSDWVFEYVPAPVAPAPLRGPGQVPVTPPVLKTQ